MTKRAASYDIDPVTFEEKEKIEGEDQLYSPEAPQVKNRKIFKYTRNEKAGHLASQKRPDLKILGLNQPAQPTNEPEASQPLGNIFKNSLAGLTQASSLFANLFSKEAGKQGITQQATGVLQPTPQDNSKASIFAPVGQSSLSIFANNSSSLFSKPNIAIFSFPNTANKSPSQNPLLENQAKQGKNEDVDGEGDSAELEKKQEMEVDPAKSLIKYNYENQSTVLKSVRLLKFKKDRGELLDCPLTASILQEQGKEVYYLSVELSATHKNIFSGLILKHKSAVKVLNKLQNLEVLVFTLEPNQKKIEAHTLKLQISTHNNPGDELQFLQALKQIIEGKKPAKDSAGE